MTDPETTFGLNPKSVASLLKLGAGPHDAELNPAYEQEKADLLRDRLAKTIPLHESETGQTSATKTRLHCTVAALVGVPIGQLVLASDTDIGTLKRVKDHGRVLSEAAGCEAEQHVANTIYYAAIAAGIVTQRKRITSFSYAALLKAFGRLAKESWMPRELSDLFEQASRVCHELMKT